MRTFSVLFSLFLSFVAQAETAHGLFVIAPLQTSDLNAEWLARRSASGMLIHALARDDESLARCRATFETRAQYGLVTVSPARSFKRLPYADNLVTVLRCDLNALKEDAPDEIEILRVLSPGGVAEMVKGGEVRKLEKPRPPEMDEWTHFDCDAAGTGVSHDKLVKPPTAVQWWMEAQPYSGLGGNPAAYRPYAGFRIAGNRAFFVLNEGRETAGKDKNPPTFLVARDAFNGLPLWKVKYSSPGNGTPQEYQFVVNHDRVFTFLGPDSYSVALDAATGEIKTTFENGARWSSRAKLSPSYYMLRATDTLLLQTAEERLFAFDSHSGALKWTYEEKGGGYVCFPRIIEKENRVLVQVVESGMSKIQGRWANLKTSAVLCLELQTGKVLWRSAAVDGQDLGQTILCDDGIYAFNPAGIGANDNPGSKRGPGLGIVMKLNASNGDLLWKSSNFKWGYNLLVRDNKPFFATPDSLETLQPPDGALSDAWRASFNNRCNRTAATDNWIIMGMGNFISRYGVATVRGISRGGCAQGVVPADGLLYYTPNTCHCITMLRGHLALSGEAPLSKIADDKRLEKSGVFATARDANLMTLSGPIPSEWPLQIAGGALETQPVDAGNGRTLVSIIHAHRLELRDGAKVLWSSTLGGRVTEPPVIDGESCYCGSHDGYLNCLSLSDGQLRWRFFAAPYQRYIVNHGQVESSWPVYNAVMHRGAICCAAGLHPETGGIFAWGLDPSSGAIRWQKHLQRSELTVKPGGKIAPNRVMNSPLISANDQLSITGITFSADESEEAINQRIDHDSMGDKHRNFGWSWRGNNVPPEKP